MARKPRRGSSRAGRRARPTAPSARTAREFEGPAAALSSGSSFSLSNAAIEAALRTGEQAGLLEDYFGPAHYAELRQLAEEAAVRSVRGGVRVLILPGIMGSTLGRRLKDREDVIWVDVFDLIRGRLAELSLASGASDVTALGAMLFAYLGLKFRLRIAGHDADFHPYDWRLSLSALGRELAQRIGREGRPVHLVAHSMGGLVARAALSGGPPRNLKRIVQLGTPNFGSFSPIQAFRGAHSIVRKVAFLDLSHDREELARDVFGTFPGLHEMLPSPEKAGVDYFDLAAWPDEGVRPEPARLAAAKRVQAQLPTSHAEGIVLIAGVEQDTAVAARVADGEFEYDISTAGDGTVPLAFAQLPGAKTYFVEEEHGQLPSNDTVAAAVDNILMTGSTTLLPESWTPRRVAAPRRVRDGQLARAPVYEGAPGRPLSQREQRQILAEFVAPGRMAPEPAHVAPAPAASPTAAERIDRVVIGRRRQHRLDVTLAHGSITDVQASAYLLGLFRNVVPAGAAQAVDAHLRGAIGDFVKRRMFGGNVGEISVMPTGRHPIRTDLVMFAGLGAFDAFREEVLEAVAENVVRTFLSTSVADFAMVPMGGGSGMRSATALRHFLKGLFRGLKDVDQEHQFRGFTICETDGERFRAIREELYRLAATELFDDVEITLTERELPALTPPAARTPLATRPPTTYLLVRREAESAGRATLGVSTLTAGAKAAIYRARKEVNEAELSQHLRRIETSAFNFAGLPAFGKRLAELVLPEDVRAILSRNADSHLVVVHDAYGSRIPWETLRLGEEFPALNRGLSHRYEADDLSVAKFLEQRQHGATLDVLLIVNPTEDLAAAETEGGRIEGLFQRLGPSARLTTLRGPEARKNELLDCFTSGRFDVVHYAGHAFFDPAAPARSGILCYGGEVLSGADLAGLGNLPNLVFFNACEAARVRRTAQERRDPNLAIERRMRGTTSFAEAFMRGGVANYLGTYWPVGDATAGRFAEELYSRLVAGERIGAAIQAGRAAVHGLRSVDWADYVFYGDPEFVLKIRD